MFSCPIGHRIVSLCASRGVSLTRGHLRYAFGRPGHVETQISTGDAAASFSEGVVAYPKGGADYVRIRSGRTAYVVYAAMVPGWEQDGVVVERDGKRVKSLLCPGYALGPDGWLPAYAAKLPRDTQGFEVPDGAERPAKPAKSQRSGFSSDERPEPWRGAGFRVSGAISP